MSIAMLKLNSLQLHVVQVGLAVTLCVIGVSVWYHCHTKGQEGLQGDVKTIVLMGDSILRNDRYVPKEQTVEAYVRRLSPRAEVINVAQDGACVSNLMEQLRTLNDRQLPMIDLLVISIGGNDLLRGHNIELTWRKLEDTLYGLKKLLKVNKLALVNLYTPDCPAYKGHRFQIVLWNQVLANTGYDIADVSRAIDNPQEQLTRCIEPNVNGSRKIAEAIVAKM